MEDEHKLLREQDRGARAERLLSDPLVVEAFAAIRADCDELFRTSKPTDDETRRIARLKLAAVDQVEEMFKHHLNTGKLAKTQLERLKATLKRVA